jgi:hypothetical protein
MHHFISQLSLFGTVRLKQSLRPNRISKFGKGGDLFVINADGSGMTNLTSTDDQQEFIFAR